MSVKSAIYVGSHFSVILGKVMCQRQSSGFRASGLCWPGGSTLSFLSVTYTTLWCTTQRGNQWHHEVSPISCNLKCLLCYIQCWWGCLQCAHMGISPFIRYILVDWLVEVATMKEFSSLALHVTVGCVDRYLARCAVPKARLQLLGIACMVICTRWGPAACHS